MKIITAILSTKLALAASFFCPLIIAPWLVYRRMDEGSHALWYWGTGLGLCVAIVATLLIIPSETERGSKAIYWISMGGTALLVITLCVTAVAFSRVSYLAALLLLVPPFVFLMRGYLNFHP